MRYFIRVKVGPLALWSQLLPGSVGIGAAMIIISLIGKILVVVLREVKDLLLSETYMV